jgi:hypothetical protein
MAAGNDLWADALADVEEVQAELSEREQSAVEEKIFNPAAQGGASETPNTEMTRQGEAPEAQPRGSALPP